MMNQTDLCVPTDFTLAPTSLDELHKLNVVAESIFIQGSADGVSTMRAVEQAAAKLGWVAFLRQQPTTTPWRRTLFYRTRWNEPGPSTRETAEFCIGYGEGYGAEWTPQHGFDAVLSAWFTPMVTELHEEED